MASSSYKNKSSRIFLHSNKDNDDVSLSKNSSSSASSSGGEELELDDGYTVRFHHNIPQQSVPASGGGGGGSPSTGRSRRTRSLGSNTPLRRNAGASAGGAAVGNNYYHHASSSSSRRRISRRKTWTWGDDETNQMMSRNVVLVVNGKSGSSSDNDEGKFTTPKKKKVPQTTTLSPPNNRRRRKADGARRFQENFHQHRRWRFWYVIARAMTSLMGVVLCIGTLNLFYTMEFGDLSSRNNFALLTIDERNKHHDTTTPLVIAPPKTLTAAVTNSHLRDAQLCPSQALRMARLPPESFRSSFFSSLSSSNDDDIDDIDDDIDDDKEGFSDVTVYYCSTMVSSVYIVGLPGTGGLVVRHALESIGYLCAPPPPSDSIMMALSVASSGDVLGEAMRLRLWGEILKSQRDDQIEKEQEDNHQQHSQQEAPKFVLTIRPSSHAFATAVGAAWRTSALGPAATDIGKERFASWHAEMTAQKRLSRRGAPWEREQEAWAFLEVWLSERHDAYARAVLEIFFSRDPSSYSSAKKYAGVRNMPLGRRGIIDSTNPNVGYAHWTTPCQLLTLEVDSSQRITKHAFVNILGRFTGALVIPEDEEEDGDGNDTTRWLSSSSSSEPSHNTRRSTSSTGIAYPTYKISMQWAALSDIMATDAEHIDRLHLHRLSSDVLQKNAITMKLLAEGNVNVSQVVRFEDAVSNVKMSLPSFRDSTKARGIAADAFTRAILSHHEHRLANDDEQKRGAKSRHRRRGNNLPPSPPPAPWVTQNAYLDVEYGSVDAPIPLISQRVQKTAHVSTANLLAPISHERLLDDVYIWPFFCEAKQFWPDRLIPQAHHAQRTRLNSSIVYATHGSIDRLPQLRRRIARWGGAASLAVYVDGGSLVDREEDRDEDTTVHSRQMRAITHQLLTIDRECNSADHHSIGHFADVHVVLRIPPSKFLGMPRATQLRYPFNALRNAAMAHVRDGIDFVLAIDADAAVGGGLQGNHNLPEFAEARIARTLQAAVDELRNEQEEEESTLASSEESDDDLEQSIDDEWTLSDEERLTRSQRRRHLQERVPLASSPADGVLFTLASFEPTAATLRRAMRPDLTHTTNSSTVLNNETSLWMDPIENLEHVPELRILRTHETDNEKDLVVLVREDGEVITSLQPFEHDAAPEAYEVASNMPRYLENLSTETGGTEVARHVFSYPIAYRCMFEPYFIMRVPSDPRVRLPAYDERYVGRYFDKTSHAFDTCRMPMLLPHHTTNDADNLSSPSSSKHEQSRGRRRLLQRLDYDDGEQHEDEGGHYDDEHDAVFAIHNNGNEEEEEDEENFHEDDYHEEEEGEAIDVGQFKYIMNADDDGEEEIAYGQEEEDEEDEHEYEEEDEYEHEEEEEDNGKLAVNERKQQQRYRTSFPAFRYRVLRHAFILDNGRVSTLESIDHLRKMKTIWDEHTLRALNDDASMEGNAGMTRHRRCSCAPEYIIHPELEESASSSSEMTPLLFRSEAPATANGTLHDEAVRSALQETDDLILGGSFHKAGSNIFETIFNDICNKCALRCQYTNHFERIDADTRSHHRCIVMIRNPYEIIASGVRYHQEAKEPWMLQSQPTYGGKSYREALRAQSSDEAKIIFEMNGAGGGTIKDIAHLMRSGEANVAFVAMESLYTEDGIRRLSRVIARHLNVTSECEERIHDVVRTRAAHRVNPTARENGYTYAQTFTPNAYHTFNRVFGEDLWDVYQPVDGTTYQRATNATANGTLHDALRRALQVSLPSPPVETARVRAFWTEHRRLMNRDDVADTTSDYTEVLGYVERTHDDRHENDDEGGISWWNTTHSRSDNNNGDDDELLKQPASLGSVHDTRSKLYRNWFGGHCHRLTQRESPGGYGTGALSRSFILRLPKIKRETSSMLPGSAVWEPPNLKSVSHYASLETAPTARSERAWWTASKGTRTTRSAGASVPMLMAMTRATDSTQLNNASRLLPPTLVAELAPAGGALHRRKGRSNLSWLAERCPIYASISAWNTDDFLGNQTKEKHDLGPPPQVIVPWQYLKETRSKSAMTTRFTLGRLPLSRGWDAMAVTLALAPGGEGTKRHASCASRLCVASLHGKGLSAGAGVVRLTIL